MANQTEEEEEIRSNEKNAIKIKLSGFRSLNECYSVITSSKKCRILTGLMAKMRFNRVDFRIQILTRLFALLLQEEENT